MTQTDPLPHTEFTPSWNDVSSRDGLAKMLTNAALMILGLMLTVTPLLYSAEVYLVFEFPKLLAIQVGIELAFLFWFLARLLQPVELFNAFQKRFLLPAFGVYLIFQGLAWWTAYDSDQAFWGSYFQRQGLWYLMHCWLLFVMLADLGRQRLQRDLLLLCLGLGAIGNLLFAGLELLNWTDYSTWKGERYETRVLSTFGQPNFFAVQLGMTLPFVWYGFGRIRNAWRWAILALNPFWLIGMWLSGSRAAWLGLLPLLSVLPFLAEKKWRLQQDISLWKTTLVGSLIGGVFILAGLWSIGQREDSWRFNQLLDPTRWEQIDRYRIWQRSLELIGESPITGYGQNNFELVFHDDQTASDPVLGGLYVDHPHSWLLSVAIDAGVIALFALVAMVVLAVYSTLTTHGNRNHFPLYLLLAMGFYLIAAALGTVSLWSTLIFWGLLGLMVALPNQIENHSEDKNTAPIPLWMMTPILIILAITAIQLHLNYRSYQAESAFKSGLHAEAAGDPALAKEYFQESQSRFPYLPYYQDYLER